MSLLPPSNIGTNDSATEGIENTENKIEASSSSALSLPSMAIIRMLLVSILM
jgi:hypothetical protein